MLATPLSIILAVLAVNLIITVHELGHLICAKAVGMRVEVFSIGFWKRIVGFKTGGTDYRLSLVPVGGYVKVSDESPHEDSGEPYGFWSKTPGQRALFIVGGAAMNFVLAVVLFIVAFAIGVPMAVAEVGRTEPEGSAWEAGLKPGDRIVAIGSVKSPVFRDLTRAEALGGGRTVALQVQRGDELLSFNLEPRYDAYRGYNTVGILPPVEPVVAALSTVGGEDSRWPAREAGIEIDDRILAINGKEVRTARELLLELSQYPHDEIELLIERQGRTLTVRVLTEPAPRRVIGISGVSSTVSALEGEGVAQELGLQIGDRIVAVNGLSVQSWLEIEQIIRGSSGEVSLEVVRGERRLSFGLNVPDVMSLVRLSASVVFESSPELTWVKEGEPAWEAGMRPGDSVVSVAGNQVTTWEDVVGEGSRVADKEHEIQWHRAGELFTGQVKAVEDTTSSSGYLGIKMDVPRMERERYGVLGAIRRGFTNTAQTVAEIFLTLKGFATRDVSPTTMGGVVRIAYVSYRAAQFGVAKLLHLTAMLSAAIGFLNILPIPALDGGHVLLLAIEKVRGRRLGQRVLGIVQSVGFALIILLIVYVTRNDIMWFLHLG